jgi:hypothetical protein
MVKIKQENYSNNDLFYATVKHLRDNHQNMRLLVRNRETITSTIELITRVKISIPKIVIDTIKIKDYGYIRYQIVVKY